MTMKRPPVAALALAAAFAVLAVTTMAGIASSTQRPPAAGQEPGIDPLGCPALSAAAVHQPQLPTVAGVSFTGCPGARRVLPPGAPVSEVRTVVVTRGRDGKSWTVPYIAEHEYEQLADGTVRERVVIPTDAVAAAEASVIPPEDLAEIRGQKSREDVADGNVPTSRTPAPVRSG